MTDDERLRYYSACKTPQPVRQTFGDFEYDDDEDAADLTDDDPVESGSVAGCPLGQVR
jgi:hypothetical protein